MLCKGFGRGTIQLNVKDNRRIILAALIFNRSFSKARRCHRKLFSLSDVYLHRKYFLHTQIVKKRQKYPIQSSIDQTVAYQLFHQAEHNKQLIRFGYLGTRNVLYAAVVNYYQVVGEFVDSSTQYEIAAVICGLGKMTKYLLQIAKKRQRKFAQKAEKYQERKCNY